jgi:hypothetical protein
MKEDVMEGEIVDAETASTGTLSVLSKAELDMQIATAKQYPRSLKQFRQECLDMATLTEDIASECLYALPRGGKTIEGPSARLAEIIASSWGNCRAGARVVGEEEGFVIAQGVFHDLQKNVAITYEVRRRITDKKGRRFQADMIGVTANAACSIALRNATLKGVPKAFWSEVYESARKTAIGDATTLSNKRAKALEYLQKLGATEDMILDKLGVAGVEDIGLDELVTLKGLATAIKDGDTTVEMAFGPDVEDKQGGAKDLERQFKEEGKEEEPPAEAKKQDNKGRGKGQSKKSSERPQGKPEQSFKDKLKALMKERCEGDLIFMQDTYKELGIDDIDEATEKDCQVAFGKLSIKMKEEG